MISGRIARINSTTPYYCPDGRICGGRCRVNPCPAGDPWTLPKADWALDWHHADPAKVLHDWIKMLLADAKPRIRVKAGSRRLAMRKEAA